MTTGDQDRGFKGLGKLGGSTPPPEPRPPEPSPAPGQPEPSPAPGQPEPSPAPGPTERPAPGRPPSSHRPGPGGMPPPAGNRPPPPPRMSGCLKIALVLLGLLVAGALGLAALGWMLAPSPEEVAARAEAAARVAAEDAAARAVAELAAQAEAERIAACRASAGARPGSGDELARHVGFGQHTLKINAGSEDALVKLRQEGRTAIAFYVRAGESGAIENVPDGSYQVMFATGGEYSVGCVEFLQGMNVSADPDPLVFAPSHENGATYYQIMEYTLTRVADGNFVPASVDAADFRE